MKTFTTMTAVAALIAGISFANAQNATTPNDNTPPPNSINAAGQNGSGNSRSGSETAATADMKTSGKNIHIVGKKKFCITQASGSNDLECKYASMQACNKEAKLMDRNCSVNPKMANAGTKETTGTKAY